jgi:hypothetical protein
MGSRIVQISFDEGAPIEAVFYHGSACDVVATVAAEDPGGRADPAIREVTKMCHLHVANVTHAARFGCLKNRNDRKRHCAAP